MIDSVEGDTQYTVVNPKFRHPIHSVAVAIHNSVIDYITPLLSEDS